MKGFMRRRGPSWELRVYLGRDPVSDRKRYATQSVRGSKRRAERVLRDMVAAAEAGDAPGRRHLRRGANRLTHQRAPGGQHGDRDPPHPRPHAAAGAGRRGAGGPAPEHLDAHASCCIAAAGQRRQPGDVQRITGSPCADGRCPVGLARANPPSSLCHPGRLAGRSHRSHRPTLPA
jgi:hypothetical protein